jgi:hypothetical protein
MSEGSIEIQLDELHATGKGRLSRVKSNARSLVLQLAWMRSRQASQPACQGCGSG